MTDAKGEPAANTMVTLTPDLEVSCMTSDVFPIYELAAAGGDQPWNYVYIDTATGGQVMPGDDNYPSSNNTSGYERIQTGSAEKATQCRFSSQAYEDLDGSSEWSIDTDFYDAYTVPLKSVIATSKGHWAGVQPGQLTVTIDVDGAQASELVDVYFAGCT